MQDLRARLSGCFQRGLSIASQVVASGPTGHPDPEESSQVDLDMKRGKLGSFRASFRSLTGLSRVAQQNASSRSVL